MYTQHSTGMWTCGSSQHARRHVRVSCSRPHRFRGTRGAYRSFPVCFGKNANVQVRVQVNVFASAVQHSRERGVSSPLRVPSPVDHRLSGRSLARPDNLKAPNEEPALSLSLSFFLSLALSRHRAWYRPVLIILVFFFRPTPSTIYISTPVTAHGAAAHPTGDTRNSDPI